VPGVTICHLLTTGYCRASEHHMIKGGARRQVDVPAQAALLRHSRHGWVLFDTGYSPRMWAATERLPYRLYRRATPLRLPPNLALAEQLPQLGVAPEEVGHVILSHFHADHCGGLRDFPAARLVATREGWADVAGRREFAAVRRAFLPDLIPDDFAERATLVSGFRNAEVPRLGPAHDLFGDGSFLLVPLPGHARGQMGLFVPDTPDGPTLFVADAVFRAASIRELRPAHPLMDLIADDPRAARETLARLHAFHRARPDVRLVTGHEAPHEPVTPPWVETPASGIQARLRGLTPSGTGAAKRNLSRSRESAEADLNPGSRDFSPRRDATEGDKGS
jgi:Zn-dependent hydrolases, including glyoxylases